MVVPPFKKEISAMCGSNRSFGALESLESRQLFSGGLPPLPLAIFGGNGSDVINVNYDANSDSLKWSVNGQNHSTPASQVSYLYIDGSSGDDQITVGAMRSGLDSFIRGGAGSDKITVGGGVINYMTSGNVTVLGDDVATNDPGLNKDQLFINAFNSVTPTFNEYYDFYKDHLHLGGFYGGAGFVAGIDVKYSGVEDVTFSGPAGEGAIYNIHSTKFGSTMHVFTGWKNDMLYVGDGDIDSQIYGNLDLKGYYGYNDFVTINDDKASTGHVYKFNQNVLSTLQTRKITLPQGEYLTLNATNYADSINVAGGYDFEAKSFAINANGGNDQITFGDQKCKLLYMQNIPLSVDGGAGNDRILMQDGYNSTGGVYHLADHKFSNNYGVSSMSYWRTETFAVGGSLTSNTFDIVPSAETKYQLYGHQMTPNNGGQTWLSLGTLGVTSPSFKSWGAGSGEYTFGNRAPIDIWQMTSYPTSFAQPQPVKVNSQIIAVLKQADLFSTTPIL
jgi:hypothetical protein